jgi:hypothetical protein
MDDRVQRVHEQIDRDQLRRHSNRVLHGHPSPTLWDEPDVPVDEILKWRRHPRSGPRIRRSPHHVPRAPPAAEPSQMPEPGQVD